MKMKKVLAIMLALVLVFSLAACGNSGDNSGGNSNGGSAGGGSSDGDTIKLGWLGALTGDGAVWGTCESQTLEMLVEQKNAEGGLLGKQIELVKYDTQGKADEVPNVTTRLTSQDNVSCIIGPNSSGQAIAMTPILTQAKTAGIATVATGERVTVDNGSLNEYNFRVCFIDPYQGAVVGSYAYDKLGCRTAAVLYDQGSDYSEGFKEYFKEEFEKLGGQVVIEKAYSAGDQDFRVQLTDIKNADVDCMLMPVGSNGDIYTIVPQVAELGLDAILLGGDTWQSEDVNKMSGPRLAGSYVCNHYDASDPALAPLQDAYHEKYGADATIEINAYMAHDAFLLWCAAVEAAGTADPDAVAAQLTKVEVDGLTGHIKLSEEDHNPVGKEASIQTYEYDEATGLNSEVFVEKYSPL